MKKLIILIIILGMVSGAYAQCQPCPGPSEWSGCRDGEQTRFVYTCNESTNFNCIGETETRECEFDIRPIAMWIIFICIVIGLVASALLLLKAKKR